MALYQFLFPLVGFLASGVPSRLSIPALVTNLNNSIFEELDSPPEPLPSSSSSEQPRFQMQCKDVGPVKRPPLPQINQPAQSSGSHSQATTRRKKPPKPSGARSKRGLSISTDSGLPEGSQPKKRTRKESTISRDKLKKKRESFSFTCCFDHRLFLLSNSNICSSWSTNI